MVATGMRLRAISIALIQMPRRRTIRSEEKRKYLELGLINSACGRWSMGRWSKTQRCCSGKPIHFHKMERCGIGSQSSHFSWTTYPRVLRKNCHLLTHGSDLIRERWKTAILTWLVQKNTALKSSRGRGERCEKRTVRSLSRSILRNTKIPVSVRHTIGMERSATIGKTGRMENGATWSKSTEM